MRLNLNESDLAELWDSARSNEAPKGALSAEAWQIFGQYRAIHLSMQKSWQNAPARAVDLAKAIMPVSARKFSIGRMIHPRPLLGLARGAVSQLQFEADEVSVRMQVEQIPGGWKMWGRTSESGWTVWSGDSCIACNEDGEFELEIDEKSIEPLSLQNETTTILLPLVIEESGDGHT